MSSRFARKWTWDKKKIVFMWKVLHLHSFWNRIKRKRKWPVLKRNKLFYQSASLSHDTLSIITCGRKKQLPLKCWKYCPNEKVVGMNWKKKTFRCTKKKKIPPSAVLVQMTSHGCHYVQTMVALLLCHKRTTILCHQIQNGLTLK